MTAGQVIPSRDASQAGNATATPGRATCTSAAATEKRVIIRVLTLAQSTVNHPARACLPPATIAASTTEANLLRAGPLRRLNWSF